MVFSFVVRSFYSVAPRVGQGFGKQAEFLPALNVTERMEGICAKDGSAVELGAEPGCSNSQISQNPGWEEPMDGTFGVGMSRQCQGFVTSSRSLMPPEPLRCFLPL